ncbi:MAG: efflux RND transporter permease subunit [Rubrivivax sp.]|nr:efflux RND transporter permease subunit [Rubrivivax sp.]
MNILIAIAFVAILGSLALAGYFMLREGRDGKPKGDKMMRALALRVALSVLLFTVIIIYMVLAVLYEHLGHPLTILTALPLAGFGALLVLLLTGEELNIFSFVGLILLIGLVKKNGIMMIDFALTRQRAGMSAEDAIVEACLVRLRPIMMTTVSTIVATLPIAIGFGAGGEARRPLGIAVVGGLVFSQFLTLYITPTFYVSMARMEAWLRRKTGTLDEAPASR